MAARSSSGTKRSSRKALASKTPTRKSAERKTATAGSNILEGFFPATNNKAMEKIMSQSKSQMDKMSQDAQAFGREGYEAFMQSSTIFVKGFEELARTAMAIAQKSAEKQAQLVNQALSSKTLNEWAETQNKIAQSNLDDLMSAATKLSEMSVKLISESSEPLNETIGKISRKATAAMAAE